MPEYRRNYVPGGTYFFTAVTHERRPILTTQLGRTYLRRAITTVAARLPFRIVALALLPDHLHTIWEMPPGDANYSMRWQRIKSEFTDFYLANGGAEGMRSPSRVRHRERGVWQRRYWEHTCRDEDDLKRCLDYVPWNPVKHGLVGQVKLYPWSTFLKFARLGEYEEDWGGVNPCPGYDEPEWE
jgi:putative transposase